MTIKLDKVAALISAVRDLIGDWEDYKALETSEPMDMTGQFLSLEQALEEVEGE